MEAFDQRQLKSAQGGCSPATGFLSIPINMEESAAASRVGDGDAFSKYEVLSHVDKCAALVENLRARGTAEQAAKAQCVAESIHADSIIQDESLGWGMQLTWQCLY